jgi:two-component sensor histidine kinase
LARTNQHLTNSNLLGGKLSDIVHLELEHVRDRTTVEGPDVALGHREAQNVSLALHELATNAMKYGGLSNSSGSVEFYWTLLPNGKDGVQAFRWQERGGPPVVAPTRKGFGTSLISPLFADAHVDYATTGLTCEFTLPLPARS